MHCKFSYKTLIFVEDNKLSNLNECHPCMHSVLVYLFRKLFEREKFAKWIK